MKHKAGYLFLALVLILASCKKYKDTPGATTDPRLQRPYCNDPEAVNYNWDFPGKPDNSVCIYPANVFQGNYTYTDSIYNGSQTFLREQTLNLSVIASSRTKLTITGFCPSGNLSFTASRRLRADLDTVVGFGQLLCRPTDTVLGSISRPEINGSIFFDFTVNSDTGVAFHRGSAVKK